MTVFEQLQKVVEAPRGYVRKHLVKDFMAESEDFRWFWMNALSPYIHFNLTASVQHRAGTCQDITPELVELLDNIASGACSGSRAKTLLAQELAKYPHEYQEHLVSMINKKPRMGVSIKTFRDIAPGFIPTFLMPLAHPVEWNKVTFPVQMSPKIDGLRCIFENGELYTRKGNKFKGLNSLKSRLIDALPGDFSGRLDGELVVPGKAFDDISGDLRSFRETDQVHYYIFDMVLDTTEPLFRRTARLQAWYQAWFGGVVNQLLVNFCPVDTFTCDSIEECTEYYDHFLTQGYEGGMVKNPNSPYFDDRSYEWQKIKPHDTVDLEVTAIYAGTGRNAEVVGALGCELPSGKEVRVGIGLSDSQRAAWMADPSLIVGKTIEVEYMEKSKLGGYRHPRLKQVRGDK